MIPLDYSLRGSSCYCHAGYVRVRTSPGLSTDTNIIPDIHLTKGDAVKLIAKSVEMYRYGKMKGSWYHIEYAPGKQGWVFFYLEPVPPLPPPPFLPTADNLANEAVETGNWKSKLEEVLRIYKHLEQQKALKQLTEACDFNNPVVRNAAVQEAAKNRSIGSFNLGQTCNIFDYASKNWKYIDDPGVAEYVAKASETIQNGRHGDCDDFAVLLYSMIAAVGGDCRINYACNYWDGCHAYAEVFLGYGDNLDEIVEYLSFATGFLNTKWRAFVKTMMGVTGSISIGSVKHSTPAAIILMRWKGLFLISMGKGLKFSIHKASLGGSFLSRLEQLISICSLGTQWQ